MVHAATVLLLSSVAGATAAQDHCATCVGCYWVHNMHCGTPNDDRAACLADGSVWCGAATPSVPAPPATTPQQDQNGQSQQDHCETCVGCYWVHNMHCGMPSDDRAACLADGSVWCGAATPSVPAPPAPTPQQSGQNGQGQQNQNGQSQQDHCATCVGCYWVHNMHCGTPNDDRAACIADGSVWCGSASTPATPTTPATPVCNDVPQFHIKDCPTCTCDWLATEADGCQKFGRYQSAVRNPATGNWWKAAEACCVCERTAPRPAPTHPPVPRVAPNGGVQGCHDIADGQTGNAFHIKGCQYCGCAWLHESGRCSAYGRYPGTFAAQGQRRSVWAREACCVCGGGQR